MLGICDFKIEKEKRLLHLLSPLNALLKLKRVALYCMCASGCGKCSKFEVFEVKVECLGLQKVNSHDVLLELGTTPAFCPTCQGVKIQLKLFL